MSELPKGWKIIRLRDEATSIKGKKPKILEVDLADGLVPYIDIKAFEKGILTKYASLDAGVNADEIDTLMVWDGARSGLVGNGVHGVIGSTLVKIKPKFSHHSYLHYFLRSKYSYINSNTKGTGIPHVDPAKLWELDYPVAPLNEQVRIADKLDSILAKVNKAQARLDKIPAILKRFRQSVLAAATSGELTKEWRNNQDYTQVIINNLDDENDPYNVWNKSKNKKIPEGWLYCKLYQLGEIQGGGTPSKSKDEYWGGEIPWVTPKDMKIDFIANSKLTVTSKGVDESSAKLIKDGSVMFVVRGMILAHSFPVAINEKMVTVNQDMKCITPSDFVDSKYLLFSLKSLKDLFVELASSSTHGTKRLESKMYRNVAISIPPMNEQIEIVKQVESLFMMADTLEKKYLEAKSRLDRLTQSFLAKAFRGELVSQSDKDESAEALLKRIKAESPKVKSNK
ncbi:MAG: type I restriction enzyme S subunit [Gammaproteobacteria bacterium]